MSKDRIVPYVAYAYDQAGKHCQIWEERVRRPYFGLGKPTDAKAEAWRVKLNESYQTGGCNEHVSKARGYIPHTHKVEVVHQPTGRVVARAKMPMFEVV